MISITTAGDKSKPDESLIDMNRTKKIENLVNTIGTFPETENMDIFGKQNKDSNSKIGEPLLDMTSDDEAISDKYRNKYECSLDMVTLTITNLLL